MTGPGGELIAVIVGPPGAGKTTAGRGLAAALGCPFADTDAAVEETAGMAVADIFVEHGEPYFRKLEAAAVLAGLESAVGVLAVGGGAVLDPVTREALRGRPVVFLDVGVADASRRVGFNRDRPLLLGNPRAAWLKLMEARRPIYEGVATVRVETDGRTPAEVVAALRSALGR